MKSRANSSRMAYALAFSRVLSTISTVCLDKTTPIPGILLVDPKITTLITICYIVKNTQNVSIAVE